MIASAFDIHDRTPSRLYPRDIEENDAMLLAVPR